MKKTLISGILALALYLTLLPIGALATAHNLTVAGESSGYHWDNDVLSFTKAGSYTLSGTTESETVVIAAQGVVLTLDGVSINVSSKDCSRLGKCALTLSETASATMILKGDNNLKSGNGCAGLGVPFGTSLTIGGDGSLVAQGGAYSAGIGADIKGGSTISGAIRIEEQAVVTASGSGAGIGNISMSVTEHVKDIGVYGATAEKANTPTNTYSFPGPDGHIQAGEHRIEVQGKLQAAEYENIKYSVLTESMASNGTCTVIDPNDNSNTTIKVTRVSSDISTIIGTEVGTFTMNENGEYTLILDTSPAGFINSMPQSKRWIWNLPCVLTQTENQQSLEFTISICLEGSNDPPSFTGLTNTDYFGQVQSTLPLHESWTATAAKQGAQLLSDVITGSFAADDPDEDKSDGLGFGAEYKGSGGTDATLPNGPADLTLTESKTLAEFPYPGDAGKVDLPAGTYKKFEFNVGDFYLNVHTGQYFFDVNDSSDAVKNMDDDASYTLPFIISVFDEHGASASHDFTITLLNKAPSDMPNNEVFSAAASLSVPAQTGEAPVFLASGNGGNTLTIAGGTVTAESTEGSALSCTVVIAPPESQSISARTGSNQSNAQALNGSPFYHTAGGHDVTALVGNASWFDSETSKAPDFSGRNHTLTFNANRGGAIPSVARPSGSLIDLSSYVPEREDYAFTGWHSDKALTQRITSLRLTEDTTVYAGWRYIGKNPFEDVSEDHWFFEDVIFAYQEGLINGTAAERFSPDLNTTRGMTAAILWRLEGKPKSDFAMGFEDVATSSYYAHAVRWAAENGITEGRGDSRFCPDDAITRQELAVFLYRYAVYKNYDVSVGEDTNILSYMDAQEIDTWAVPAIQWAVGSGIMKGTGDALLPTSSALRSETAAMFRRFVEAYVPADRA